MACLGQASGQTAISKVDDVKFFTDTSILQVTMSLDMKSLFANKLKDGFTFPATFTSTIDNVEISEPVVLEVRGKYRKANCYLPPIKVIFKNKNAPMLSSLGSLKLVNVCEVGRKDNTEYLLKEYLIYKIYNLITDKSLRVRLLKVNFVDAEGKKKTISEYAYLMEDVKDMAKRNNYVERKRPVNHTEETHRQTMTRVALFEYMIANVDWSVPAGHNIKLIVPKEDTNDIPYPVPYDFDHSGLVKTDYALPPPNIDIQDVTERRYRGFPRQMQELQLVVDEYNLQRDNIYKLIQEFELLSPSTRKDMIGFLKGFFNVLSKPNSIQTEFIKNARKD
jgi:hypothetical protein